MSDNPAGSQPSDHKHPTESEPLLTQQSTSTPVADRPRTVRHHRRALSGRSTRSHLSGQISFGPSYNPPPHPNDPAHRQIKHEADGRARSRFFKALLVGIGLWLVVGFVFGWAGLHRAGWGQTKNRIDYGAKPSVPHSDGQPISCAKFENPQSTMREGSRMPGETFKSKATFSIPLAELVGFFIHGQGSFAKGQVSIAANSQSNEAEIEVTALTNDEALVDLMTVCHVDQNPARNLDHLHFNQSLASLHNVGLGVYTPTPEFGPYPDSDLEFRVKVNLPNHLSSISKLSVKANLFSIATDDLSGLPVEKVEIITTVGSIKIDELVSDQIEIRTNNGYIEGSFKVSKTLDLATTNGAIIAKVALALPTNHPSLSYSEPSSLSEQPAPSVMVDIASINGAVSVHYVEHPIDLRLWSYVKSTNGRAHVAHDPAYEGDFEVETTWGSADVKVPSKTTKDPTGRGRTRQKYIKTNRDELGFRHISGTVWWGENDKETRENKSKLGHTLVKTTLGSARATFH